MASLMHCRYPGRLVATQPDIATTRFLILRTPPPVSPVTGGCAGLVRSPCVHLAITSLALHRVKQARTRARCLSEQQQRDQDNRWKMKEERDERARQKKSEEVQQQRNVEARQRLAEKKLSSMAGELEDLRIDPFDNTGPWTQSDFEEHHGGLHEWNLAALDADGFSVRQGQDAFPGDDAYEMPASDIQACKRLCKERGFSAFTVWQDTAYFRKQSLARVCMKVEDVMDATMYLAVQAEVERLQMQLKLKSWAQRQQRLVALEWSEEEQQVRKRLVEWPLERLIREGLAITGLKAQGIGRFYGEPIVRFAFSDGKPLRQHEFQRGDEVLVSEGGPLQEEALRAQVISVLPEAIHCVMQAVPHLGTKWRLDRGANGVVHERTVKAIDHFESDKFQAKEVRKVLLGLPGLHAHNTASTPLILTMSSSAHLLNEPQQEAFRFLEHRRVGLIQGPPGCGKTYTACALLQAARREGKPLLAVADSHVAVDQLLGGLVALGVRAVRLGPAASVTDEALRKVSMQALFEEHPRHQELLDLRDSLSNAMRDLSTLKRQARRSDADKEREWQQWAESSDRAFAQQEALVAKDVKNAEAAIGSESDKGESETEEVQTLDQLLKMAEDSVVFLKRNSKQTEGEMVADIVRGAEVVCSTLGGCGSDALSDMSFDFILVDEATQSTEPRVLIAINKLSPEGRLVLVGDQQQLPPVCVSQAACKQGLGISLFERLLDHVELQPVMLKVQFRMHPLISRWPSQTFYAGQLMDGVTAEQRPAVPGFAWPNGGQPVAFIPVTSAEQDSGDGASKTNSGECAVVQRVVSQLLQHLDPKDLGVISPYRGQVRSLKRLLGKSIEVRTIDGYQGREKPVIVMSCVRSNSKGQVGFLADYRRLNVAITRAQRGLIVIGDPETLKSDAYWRSWLEFVAENKLFLDANST